MDVTKWRKTVPASASPETSRVVSESDNSFEIMNPPKFQPRARPEVVKPSSYASMAARGTPPSVKSRYDARGTANEVIDLADTSVESSLPSVKKAIHMKPFGQYVDRLPQAAPTLAQSISSTSSGPSLVQLSLKDKIKQEVFAENKKQGIPLGAPRDPTKYTLSDRTNDALPDVPGASHYMQEAEAEKALKDLVSSIYADMNEVDTSEAMPEGLNCTLLPHQVTGVQWMKSREKSKKFGGILADDMGLGKTIQSIALIMANKPASGRPKGTPKGTLVVAPVALMYQWKTEIEAKVLEDYGLKVRIHHGPSRTKDPKVLMKYDVVLTSYPTLASEWPTEPKESKASKAKAATPDSDSDSDDSSTDGKNKATCKAVKKPIKKTRKLPDPGPLFEADWHRVILDEAHNIKNRGTKAAKACYELNAKYRCLTGTPIQNTVEDMFSLFCFMRFPKPLHEFSEFKQRILDPIKKKTGGVAMKRLQAVLVTVMLRRTKTTMINGKPLLELPPRNIEVLKSDFIDEEERKFYTAVQEKQELQISKYIKAGTVMNNMTSVLTAILRMRQACSHPYLIQKSNAADDKEAMMVTQPKDLDAVDEDLDDLANALGGLGISSKSCTVCHIPFSQKPACEMNAKFCVDCDEDLKRFSGLTTSTKITQLMQTLERIRKEDPMRKTIVFSQFTSMLDLVKPFLKRAGFKFVNYDGKMKIDQREESLRTIKEDPKCTVILVSFKCGSVGLNLTCCSVVCLLDLWWNPALENQAIDRAHRFGQTRAVDVYKFTIRDTIEERILVLQEQKMEVAKAAIDGGDFKGGQKLGLQDIMHLFNRGNED